MANADSSGPNTTTSKSNTIPINVGIHGDVIRDKLVIHSVYGKEQKMKQIFSKITNYVNTKYDPVKYEIHMICSASFTEAVSPTRLENKSLTAYDIKEIKTEGLSVRVEVKYNHKVCNVSITCPEMKRLGTTDPMKCSVYRGMKEHYKFCAANLYHLEQYTHLTDEYGAKTECRYKDACKAYKRLENGGNALNDKCHMKMFRHPPRKRNIKLQDNVNAFIINKNEEENHDKYAPTNDDKQRYNWNKSDGYLRALMEEVIANEFGSDLCLECGVNDECKHGEEHSILRVVDQKMNDHRHVKLMGKPLNRAQMLSLILYTGCECNYDLCSSQRDGDYSKWKWFDHCLYEAIRRLSQRERGCFSVYSGLNNVQLATKSVKCGYFKTYVSTAWNKDVAQAFIGNDKGMIINIDKEFKNNGLVKCCDVSWISKFPDECEVLFARSMRYTYGDFECVVLDDANGVQSVSLKKN